MPWLNQKSKEIRRLSTILWNSKRNKHSSQDHNLYSNHSRFQRSILKETIIIEKLKKFWVKNLYDAAVSLLSPGSLELDLQQPMQEELALSSVTSPPQSQQTLSSVAAPPPQSQHELLSTPTSPQQQSQSPQSLILQQSNVSIPQD